MKAFIYPALIATAIATSAFTFITDPTLWRLKDENYSVKIHSSKFDGVFKGLQTEILFDENNLSSAKIKATIDANSINTGNGMRNKHAKQGLDAQKFNKISFESTSVSKTSTGYEANGKLTIKDVTKEIKLPFTFSKTSDGGTFQGKFSVKPSEYTVKKAGTPELIEIELNVPVIK